MRVPSAECLPDSPAVQEWIALMGRRDEPTDGVDDYCRFLSGALAERGIRLQIARVSWDKEGWVRALWKLRQESKRWRGHWVLLHYTAMAWSRRGFPLGALIVAQILKWQGARGAVVFHEFSRQHSSHSLINRLRGKLQAATIRGLYRKASRAIFTVPLESVSWLPADHSKSHFIPIGANVPERLEQRAPSGALQPRTVVVFGVTGAPNLVPEVEVISEVMKRTAESIRTLRLVLCGRGSSDAEKLLAPSLQNHAVEVVSKGILSANAVADELHSADAYLFVRGPINLQRGSALAGIACGVPIVGYRNGKVMYPLDEAGIEWAPFGERGALAQNLVAVLSDEQKWAHLHERNLHLQRTYFGWNRIADEYLKAFSQ
jgi:glycosyltransferase involved in cell wall biosynthesis